MTDDAPSRAPALVLGNNDLTPSTAVVATKRKRSVSEIVAAEQRRKRRQWIAAVAVAAVVMVFAAGLAALLRPRPVPLAARFRTAAVSHGDVLREVIATGNLEAVTTVEVGAEISGRIAAVEADFNDAVQRGQVLARFDQAVLVAQRDQAHAALVAARAMLAQSEADEARALRDDVRAQALVATHTISEATSEDRRTAREVAQARVHAARADLALRRAAFDVAETNLSHTVIRAPIDGFVIVRNVDPGQTVASVLQTPVLFTVAADLREMRVIAAVDEADIGEVAPGQAATFTVNAYRERTFRATVEVVRSAPQIVHDVVTYGVELAVDNHDLALKPGMTASVHIATDRAQGVLRVPVAALGFVPPDAQPAAGPALWVLEQDRLRRIAVVPGVADGEVVAVVGPGLVSGARVLVDLTPEGRAAYADPR